MNDWLQESPSILQPNSKVTMRMWKYHQYSIYWSSKQYTNAIKHKRKVTNQSLRQTHTANEITPIGSNGTKRTCCRKLLLEILVKQDSIRVPLLPLRWVWTLMRFWRLGRCDILLEFLTMGLLLPLGFLCKKSYNSSTETCYTKLHKAQKSRQLMSLQELYKRNRP